MTATVNWVRHFALARAVLRAIHGAFARDDSVQREDADCRLPHFDLARSFVSRDESVKTLLRNDEVEEFDALAYDHGRVQTHRTYVRSPKSLQHREELFGSDVAHPQIDGAASAHSPQSGRNADPRGAHRAREASALPAAAHFREPLDRCRSGSCYRCA